MKLYKMFITGLLILSVIKPSLTFPQDATKEKAEEQPPVIVITTAHFNLDYKDGSFDDWKKLEKEYFDKVVSKNEDLRSASVLVHYYTEDNSEIKFIRVVNDWCSIEKADERNNQLIQEAWPDKENREAFFNKVGKYYTNKHSDEIYQAIKGVKFLDKSEQGKEHVVYMRIRHRAFPEDGSRKEFEDLNNEYVENVTHKNPKILGYFPFVHLYGSDGRDFCEVFVVNSLDDLEKSSDNIKNLVDAHWPDKEKRKEFFEKYNKYFTGWHADYIYHNVPELSKVRQ